MYAYLVNICSVLNFWPSKETAYNSNLKCGTE